MLITHVAGIDLAANGWTIVRDQMLATAANDNWHQTDIGLLRDYPRPFQLTLITQSTSRSTITSRVASLLSTLDVSRDYHHYPNHQLTLTVLDGSTTYYVSFWPRLITSAPLQWTGMQYVQQITIAGDILAPPWGALAQQLPISALTAYNTQSWSFSGTSYWSPGYIDLFSVGGGVFGGMWIVETSRNAPSNALGVVSIPNSSPSSTAITIGSVTARQMGAAGTYTFTMVLGAENLMFDVWLHFFSTMPATITLTTASQPIAVIVTNPNQLCYYVGTIAHQGVVTIVVTTTAANAILYPFVRMMRRWGRMMCYLSSVGGTVLRVIWGNPIAPTPVTRIEITSETPMALAGAVDCWLPQQGVLVATWSTHSVTMSGNLYRFPVAPGLL